MAHEITHDHDEHAEHGLGHIVHPGILWATGLFLILMTVVTVAVTYVDAGEMNMPIALGIAVIKATLVGLFFMHLRWDRPFNAMIFVTSIVLVGLLMMFTLMDTGQNNPSMFKGNPSGVQELLDAQAPMAPITAEKQIH
jgi:cytochrome c oxidase subunit 4